MFLYHKIRIGSTWLTSTALSSGVAYISEITGLDKLALNRQSSVFTAIDGTVYKQYQSNKGLPISIKFPLIDSTTFSTIVAAINNSDNSGVSIPLYITGPLGTYALNVISSGIDTPGNAIAAGIQNVTFSFVIAATDFALTANSKALTLTSQAVTLTYSN